MLEIVEFAPQVSGFMKGSLKVHASHLIFCETECFGCLSGHWPLLEPGWRIKVLRGT